MPRGWMAAAQFGCLWRDCPAQPPALPAVVHRPALRPEAMAAFLLPLFPAFPRLCIPHSALCTQGFPCQKFLCHFPRLSLDR